MTTATLTLSDFLLARIAEDEAAAVVARDGDDWHAPDECNVCDATYAARAKYGDPTRVLAECAAKRRIVELHELVTADYTGQWWTDHNAPQGKYVITGCANCTSCGVDGDSYIDDGPCPTLRLLAMPYAEHPDYREEWRV